MFHLSLTEPAAKLLTNNVQANNHKHPLRNCHLTLGIPTWSVTDWQWCPIHTEYDQTNSCSHLMAIGCKQCHTWQIWKSFTGRARCKIWVLKKLYISRAHRMLANSQSFGQLGWGTACPKTNLPKGSSSFQIHRSRWKISSELMAPPGRLKGIPWQQELQTSDLIVWQLPKNISPRNASVCSSWENQDLGCLEEGCFAAQRKEGNVEPKPFETLRKPGYGLHSFVQS